VNSKLSVFDLLSHDAARRSKEYELKERSKSVSNKGRSMLRNKSLFSPKIIHGLEAHKSKNIL